MNILKRKSITPVVALVSALIFLVFATVFTISSTTHAQDAGGVQNAHLITIHDRGNTKVILSKASTIGNAIADAGIPIDKKDLVEPDVNQKLIATHYQVNIYRARPVLVIDGNIRQKVITPYQTPLQIAASVGIVVYPEDITTISRVDDLISGAGLQMTIKRATPFEFTLYGKTSTVRTQAATIGGMLSEKGIKLTKDDRVQPGLDTKIVFGLPVKVWREGKQTITTEEPINFEIEKIQDADQPVGYVNITTPGVPGARNVTYEIVVADGQEVSRTEIASLTTKQPQKQIEVVGAKLSFSGDFAAALAKLRACESGGNYANKNNSTYRGAYQYSYGTWADKYGIYDPADATPAQQDQAARETYVRRGWQPWPVCGAAVLPDSYR
jgi:uncharacterized protein YabE (DUF348 family)